MNMDVQETFSNSADDTKMGGMRTMREDKARVPNDGDSLDHWAKADGKKFNEDKCKLFFLSS